MAVYVDELRDWGWKLGKSCHMIADTNEELHAMAERIGLKRAWFQAKASGPHYDLTASRRAKAVKCGAVELDTKAFVEKLRAWREQAKSLILAADSEEAKETVRRHLFR